MDPRSRVFQHGVRNHTFANDRQHNIGNSFLRFKQDNLDGSSPNTRRRQDLENVLNVPPGIRDNHYRNIKGTELTHIANGFGVKLYPQWRIIVSEHPTCFYWRRHNSSNRTDDVEEVVGLVHRLDDFFPFLVRDDDRRTLVCDSDLPQTKSHHNFVNYKRLKKIEDSSKIDVKGVDGRLGVFGNVVGKEVHGHNRRRFTCNVVHPVPVLFNRFGELFANVDNLEYKGSSHFQKKIFWADEWFRMVV